MKIKTIFVAFALIAIVVLFEGTAASGPKVKHDISELTPLERVLLRLTKPELYKAWFPRNGGESKTPGILIDYSIFDFLNIDLPTLILQFSDLGDPLLPSLQYVYEFYFCYIGICAGSRTEYDFAQPEVRNANLTSLNTKINATNLEIELIIPDFQIISEKFTMLDRDLVTNDVILWRGLSFFISNYTVRLSASLEMVPNVGLQLSNTSIHFEVGDFRLRKENATHTLPDGTAEEWGEVETQYAEDMNLYWIDFRNDITAYFEGWLNCFLTTGKAGDQCSELMVNELQIGNFVQMLQVMGLGIAQKSEQVEKKSIAEINGETSLLASPLLFPQFPFVSIKSTLLNLPTFLVHLGRLLNEFLDPEYTAIEEYPLSYDFIRQNCSSGVCRDIQERMILPAFGMGGFSENRIQYDIQPTNFSFSLKVPSVSFDAGDLHHETTDLESGFKEVYLGAQLTIVNCGFAISGDYELKEGVGLQVSNLGLTLRLGELQLLFAGYYSVENGEEIDHGELRLNIAPQFMEIWSEVDENGVSFERRYEEYVQNVLNAYLNGETSLY